MKRSPLIPARWALPVICCAALTSIGAARPVPTPSPAPVLKAPSSGGAPVVFAGRSLFAIQERVASFSPRERAEAVAARLERLASDPIRRTTKLTVTDADTASDILAGDLVLMTVTDADAAAAGVDRRALARVRARTLEDALTRTRAGHRLAAIMITLAEFVALTLVLLTFMRVIRALLSAATDRLRPWCGRTLRPLRIQRLELASAERMTDVLVTSLRLLRFAATVAILIVYVVVVLDLFPWTRGYSRVLLAYATDPLLAAWRALLEYLPRFSFLVVTVVLTYYVIRLVHLVFDALGNGTIALPGFEREWAQPTHKIVRFFIIVLSAVVAFPYVPGSESPAFKGISLFLGVLLSFSSSSAISNIVAGVILTYTGAFSIGDRVKIADTEGDVVEKRLLVTRVRTIKNVEVTIPNSLVLGNHLVNFSRSRNRGGLILHTAVTIGYDAPWRRVHELLIEAALATSGIAPAPPPFVLQTSLGDFYVTYEINAYTAEPSRMAAIYSELHQNVQDRFADGGIEIMSPHYAALRDGNAIAVPEAKRPRAYRSPAFQVERRDPGGA